MCAKSIAQTYRLIVGSMLILTATRAFADEPKTVYQSDFAHRPAKEWSNGHIDFTPRGQRHFLGRFSAEEVKLTLADLPPHARVRVSFDLFVIQSWDGVDPAAGPDIFDLTVEHGPRLLHTCFSNHQNMPDKLACYPGIYGVDLAPGTTGAAEVGTLGYSFPPTTDSVFHIERTCAHEQNSITLIFAGVNLQGVGDESWGLEHVRMEVLDAAPKAEVDAKMVANLWNELDGNDAKKTAAATASLVQVGDAAIPELHNILRAADQRIIDDEQRAAVERLIADLDSDAFLVRERASAKLKLLGPVALGELRRTLESIPSPEVKMRVLELLQERAINPLEAAQPPLLRMISAMELIGTPDAKQLLRDLVHRADSPDSVAEAKAALARLDGK